MSHPERDLQNAIIHVVAALTKSALEDGRLTVQDLRDATTKGIDEGSDSARHESLDYGSAFQLVDHHQQLSPEQRKTLLMLAEEYPGDFGEGGVSSEFKERIMPLWKNYSDTQIRDCLNQIRAIRRSR